MPTKTRVTIVAVLILLGGALFYYCAIFYPIEITTQVKGGSTTVAGSEPTPDNQTSICGEENDKSGQVNKTSSKGKSRPRTGST
jgi:hypothetical protein